MARPGDGNGQAVTWQWQAVSWQWPGRDMATARPWPGRDLAIARPLHGNNTVLHGNGQAVTWQSYDYDMATTRPWHDHRQAKTSPGQAVAWQSSREMASAERADYGDCQQDTDKHTEVMAGSECCTVPAGAAGPKNSCLHKFAGNTR